MRALPVKKKKTRASQSTTAEQHAVNTFRTPRRHSSGFNACEALNGRDVCRVMRALPVKKKKTRASQSTTAEQHAVNTFKSSGLPSSRLPIYLPTYWLTTYWGGHKQRYDFWPSLVLGTSAAWSDVWLSHFFQDNPMCLLSTHFGNSCEPKVRGNVP